MYNVFKTCRYKDPFAKLTVFNYFFKAKINAQVYQYLNCLDCAKRELENASKLLPSYTEDLNKLSENIKTLNFDNPKTALEMLQLAKKRFANSPAPTLMDMNRSLYDLKRAEVLDPDNEEVLGGLGELYEMIGLYDYAIEKYTKADRINPGSTWQESIERATMSKNKINIGKYF
jgi:tetratricopeptide (TPR) repeat protein